MATFAPKLSGEEAKILCCRYDYEKDSVMEYAGYRIREHADFSRKHFDTIFTWKTNGRGKSRPQKNEDTTVERALKLVVHEVDQPKQAMNQLTQLSGVGVPVASAIMTAVFPERFTVIDFRALQTLGVEKYPTNSVPKYLDYVSFCKELAASWGMTLRDLDRALWKWSEMKSNLLMSITDKHKAPTLL